MTTRLHLPMFLSLLMLTAPGLWAQTPVPSDRVRVAALLREAASATAPKIVSGRVVIATRPVDAPPSVLQVFTEEFQRSGIAVYAENDSADKVTIDIREMNSSTVSLANSSYLRRISVQLGVLVQSRTGREPYWSKSFPLSVVDTLSTEPDDIDYLEDESGSIWDSVLIPAAVSAATVVIAVLLFTVRGS